MKQNFYIWVALINVYKWVYVSQSTKLKSWTIDKYFKIRDIKWGVYLNTKWGIGSKWYFNIIK